jgi:hypothetical protein
LRGVLHLRDGNDGFAEGVDLVLFTFLLVSDHRGLEPPHQGRQRRTATSPTERARCRDSRLGIRIQQGGEQAGLRPITSGPTQEIAGETAGIRLERFPFLLDGFLGYAAQALEGGERDLHKRFVVAGEEDGNHRFRTFQQAEELHQRESCLQVRRGEALEGIAEDLGSGCHCFANAADQLFGLS